jgi:hypothetical protein
MKKIIILSAFWGLMAQTACSQKANDTTPKKVDAALTQVIETFVKGGDA